jgi:hypothetical protein
MLMRCEINYSSIRTISFSAGENSIDWYTDVRKINTSSECSLRNGYLRNKHLGKIRDGRASVLQPGIESRQFLSPEHQWSFTIKFGFNALQWAHEGGMKQTAY